MVVDEMHEWASSEGEWEWEGVEWERLRAKRSDVVKIVAGARLRASGASGACGRRNRLTIPSPPARTSRKTLLHKSLNSSRIDPINNAETLNEEEYIRYQIQQTKKHPLSKLRIYTASMSSPTRICHTLRAKLQHPHSLSA